MSGAVQYLSNKSSEVHIIEHLLQCNADFVPPLSSRVDINSYAKKIANRAMRFEAWSGDTLVGLVAAYCNDRETRIAYITSVSVLKAWAGKGIATRLINQCFEHANALDMQLIRLEVASSNTSAIRLYKKNGFVESRANASFVTMDHYLKSGNEHEQQA